MAALFRYKMGYVLLNLILLGLHTHTHTYIYILYTDVYIVNISYELGQYFGATSATFCVYAKLTHHVSTWPHWHCQRVIYWKIAWLFVTRSVSRKSQWVVNKAATCRLQLWIWSQFYQTRSAGSMDQGSTKNALLSIILSLQLLTFLACGMACSSHMTQNLVTVGAKLLTGEWFSFDPWSMDQADLVW